MQNFYYHFKRPLFGIQKKKAMELEYFKIINLKIKIFLVIKSKFNNK